jgi:hypothetical protein
VALRGAEPWESGEGEKEKHSSVIQVSVVTGITLE